MGLFDNFFRNKNKREDTEEQKVEVSFNGNSVNIGDSAFITVSVGTVGSLSGSTFHDFYVYEWFIKNSGEVFYVGKGRGDRYKEYHDRAYEAEKIREAFDTDVRFVAENLSEEEALELETREMTRILNETDYILTNRITPLFTKRDNGYSKSYSVPEYKFETAPVFYVTKIDEHYFNYKFRPFDEVDYDNLARPAFIQKGVGSEQVKIIYGGQYEKYYNEVVALLEQNGSKILKTKYAKSVTAWIYPCDDDVINYHVDEAAAENRIGRHIPVYHLIDVWKYLNEKFGSAIIEEITPFEIHPTHTRVPLSNIRNRNNWEKGYDDGFKYWEEGEAERKAGRIEKAIQLFDLARYNGYLSSVLYDSYAKAYRKTKDLDNEIDILNEAIERYRAQEGDNSQIIIVFDEQKKKALEKLKKRKN